MQHLLNLFDFGIGFRVLNDPCGSAQCRNDLLNDFVVKRDLPISGEQPEVCADGRPDSSRFELRDFDRDQHGIDAMAANVPLLCH